MSDKKTSVLSGLASRGAAILAKALWMNEWYWTDGVAVDVWLYGGKYRGMFVSLLILGSSQSAGFPDTHTVI